MVNKLDFQKPKQQLKIEWKYESIVVSFKLNSTFQPSVSVEIILLIVWSGQKRQPGPELRQWSVEHWPHQTRSALRCSQNSRDTDLRVWVVFLSAHLIDGQQAASLTPSTRHPNPNYANDRSSTGLTRLVLLWGVRQMVRNWSSGSGCLSSSSSLDH